MGGGSFFMIPILGEFYGEDSLEEILNGQEEDSVEKVPQVATQNSVEEVCQGERHDCVPTICQGPGKGKASCPGTPWTPDQRRSPSRSAKSPEGASEIVAAWQQSLMRLFR